MKFDSSCGSRAICTLCLVKLEEIFFVMHEHPQEGLMFPPSRFVALTHPSFLLSSVSLDRKILATYQIRTKARVLLILVVCSDGHVDAETGLRVQVSELELGCPEASPVQPL
jgi:hypothetical protein